MNEDLTPVRCGCGGEAYVSLNGFLEYHVVCASCGMKTDWFRSKERAVIAWNKAMYKDINVPSKGFWKPVYESEATGFDPSLAGYDPVFNHVCSVCGQETLTNDLGEEYLSDFCPHCGEKMNWGE